MLDLDLDLEMLAFHHLTAPGKQFWTHAALTFTTIYAVFVSASHVVQLATVIPAKLKGASEATRRLEQVPHSLFRDHDAVGYVAMGLACLLAVPAVSGVGLERWVRYLLIAHALVTPLIGIVYFCPTYSTRLLSFGFPWATTAPLFMLMLTIMLQGRQSEGAMRPHSGLQRVALRDAAEAEPLSPNASGSP
jgi:hypothetical protein